MDETEYNILAAVMLGLVVIIQFATLIYRIFISDSLGWIFFVNFRSSP